MHRLLLTTSILLSVVIITPVDARAEAHIGLTIMGAPISPMNSEIGHAFMCISIRLSSGIKEDCYGFYPSGSGLKKIYGPGVVLSEAGGVTASRFSRVTVSIQTEINETQRLDILRRANAWNNSTFNLASRNCNDFVKEIANAVGLFAPEPLPLEFPSAYIKRIGLPSASTSSAPAPPVGLSIVSN